METPWRLEHEFHHHARNVRIHLARFWACHRALMKTLSDHG